MSLPAIDIASRYVQRHRRWRDGLGCRDPMVVVTRYVRDVRDMLNKVQPFGCVSLIAYSCVHRVSGGSEFEEDAFAPEAPDGEEAEESEGDGEAVGGKWG